MPEAILGATGRFLVAVFWIIRSGTMHEFCVIEKRPSNFETHVCRQQSVTHPLLRRQEANPQTYSKAIHFADSCLYGDMARHASRKSTLLIMLSFFFTCVVLPLIHWTLDLLHIRCTHFPSSGHQHVIRGLLYRSSSSPPLKHAGPPSRRIQRP